MIARRLAVMLVCAVAGAAVPAPARAGDVCPTPWEGAAGPLPGGAGPADFGAIPEPCGASAVAARVRGALLAAPSKPDFYGNVLGSVTLLARRAIDNVSWFSVALDAFDYRYVNSGGLAATSVSLGPPTVAYYRTLAETERTTSAAYARVLLPLDTARASGVETGLEIGASARARLRPRLVVDGGLAVTAPFDVVGGEVHGRLQPVALAEAWFSPRPPIGIAAGAAAKVEVGSDLAFISAVPRVAGRFALRHRLWLAALVEAPVAGSDRTNLIASLFLGYAP
jgi:hypothetical protein